MVKKTKNSTFYHTILSLPVLRKIKCPKRRIVGHYRHIEKKIHSKNAQKQRFCLTEFRDCDYTANKLPNCTSGSTGWSEVLLQLPSTRNKKK